jgi:hypothetical protein
VEDFGDVDELWMTDRKFSLKIAYAFFYDDVSAKNCHEALCGTKYPDDDPKAKRVITKLLRRDYGLMRRKECEETRLDAAVPYEAIKSLINVKKEQKLQKAKDFDERTRHFDGVVKKHYYDIPSEAPDRSTHSRDQEGNIKFLKLEKPGENVFELFDRIMDVLESRQLKTLCRGFNLPETQHDHHRIGQLISLHREGVEEYCKRRIEVSIKKLIILELLAEREFGWYPAHFEYRHQLYAL